MVGGPSEVYASSRAADFCAGMNPLSLKDLLKGCLLVAFFEKPPVLPWTLRDLRKPTSPPLPLREGPPLISVFSPQGRRGNRPTRCSNRFAIWLADHQRSTPAAELRFFVRDKPQGHTMLDACSMLMEPHGYDEECSMLIALATCWDCCLWGRRDTNRGLLLWGRRERTSC